MAREGKGLRQHQMAMPLALLGLALVLVGLAIAGPAEAARGLWAILTAQDVLITDYMAIGGPGAALVNAGLVGLITAGLLWLCAEPFNGMALVSAGLMIGFSLFGKNFVNIWPILLGSWLYAGLKREPFSKYVHVGLLATSLAPAVSFMAMGGDRPRLWLGALTGVAIGFLIPPLAAYTFRIQNGMNLYNVGFACGLLGMLLVPVLKAFGLEPASAHFWATGYNVPIGGALSAVCVLLILSGWWKGGRDGLSAYRHLLSTSGRAPSDYLRVYGIWPVLVSMGVNGLLATGYIMLIGGDLNGPTLGGILTIMGFSAYGKHARNIVPVMAGGFLGSLFNHVPGTAAALQLAGLFGTTLAPFAGHFGWPYGVLAGFIHASVVLHAGLPLEGMNLYNNGFSGGLIAIVLYPVLTSLVRHRRPVLQEEDYFAAMEEDGPLEEDELDTRRSDDPPPS